MIEDTRETPGSDEGDVLEAYLSQKRMEQAELEQDSAYYIVIASALCPVCAMSNIVHPRHLHVLICRGCGEPLIVMLASFKAVAPKQQSIVTFRLLAKDGRWSWLFDPRRTTVDQFFGASEKE